MSLHDEEYMRISKYVHKHFGIHLPEKKKTLIESRLSKVLQDRGFESYHAYMDYVERDSSGEGESELLNRLTTNHTFFYREHKHFDFFSDTVLPFLEQFANLTRDIRVWSAGCSTGDEPYTLSIIMKEYFGKEASKWDLQVLATDISTDVLEIAKRGVYACEQIEALPENWKRKYTRSIGDEKVQVEDTLRNGVVFRRFNLMRQFPFRRKFHVIFCRNVMIYFTRETKRDLVNRFYRALEPGGYLFIGHSETLDRSECPFTYIMPSVYRKDIEDIT